MTKVIKYMLAVMVVAVMFICPNTYALETGQNINVSPRNESMITPYGTSKPDKGTIWSWSNGGCPISGFATNVALYTNYNFSSVTSLGIEFTSNTFDTQVELWEVDGGTLYFDKKVATKTAYTISSADESNGITRSIRFNNLNASSKYYLKFLAPTSFTATVTP